MNKNNKHTPAPWKIVHGHYQKENGNRYFQIEADGHAICCNQFCFSPNTNENAQLISRAPTLLKELEDLAELVEAHIASGEVSQDAFQEQFDKALMEIKEARK